MKPDRKKKVSNHVKFEPTLRKANPYSSKCDFGDQVQEQTNVATKSEQSNSRTAEAQRKARRRVADEASQERRGSNYVSGGLTLTLANCDFGAQVQ